MANESSLINVTTLFEQTFSKVREFGSLESIESWRLAYPQTEFMDIDEGMSGEPIDWSKRTPDEIAVYLYYMLDTQAAHMGYKLEALGDHLYRDIDDSEMFWWIWFAGAMRDLATPSVLLPEKAKEALFGYAIMGPQKGFIETLLGELDFNVNVEVSVLGRKVLVARPRE